MSVGFVIRLLAGLVWGLSVLVLVACSEVNPENTALLDLTIQGTDRSSNPWILSAFDRVELSCWPSGENSIRVPVREGHVSLAILTCARP